MNADHIRTVAVVIQKENALTLKVLANVDVLRGSIQTEVNVLVSDIFIFHENV